MLRGFCVAVALCAAGPVGAATVTGVAYNDGGDTSFDQSFPAFFLGQGQQRMVTLTFDPSLSVSEARLADEISIDYKRTNGVENTIFDQQLCSLTLPCHRGSIDVGSNSITWTFTVPANFDLCDQASPPNRCKEAYGFLGGGIFASFATIQDVNYSLEISDPNGSPVPEPATWALMLAGFGVTGGALRRQHQGLTATPA